MTFHLLPDGPTSRTSVRDWLTMAPSGPARASARARRTSGTASAWRRRPPRRRVPPRPAAPGLPGTSARRGLAAVDETQDEGHREDDQEDEEQDLADLGGAGGNPAESEYRREQRDHEEHCSPVKHCLLLFRFVTHAGRPTSDPRPPLPPGGAPRTRRARNGRRPRARSPCGSARCNTPSFPAPCSRIAGDCICLARSEPCSSSRPVPAVMCTTHANVTPAAIQALRRA